MKTVVSVQLIKLQRAKNWRGVTGIGEMIKSNLRVVSDADNRSSVRAKSLRSGKIVFGGDLFSRDCTIRDVSEDGVRVKIADPNTIPNEFTLLDIRKFMAFKAKVKWRRGNELGLSIEDGCSLDDTRTLHARQLRAIAIEAKGRMGG